MAVRPRRADHRGRNHEPLHLLDQRERRSEPRPGPAGGFDLVLLEALIMPACVSVCAERELVTPPLDGIILPGVTRQSLLDLARTWVSSVSF